MSTPSAARTLIATCAGWGVYVTWSWFLTAPLASAPAATTSARPALVAETAPASPTPAAQLAGIVESIDAGPKVVAEALERLSSVEWLAVKIRTRQPAAEPRALTEGTLQRGPNGCTRLVMSYRSGDRETHTSEIICDGRVLAQVIHRSSGDDISSWDLPKSDAGRDKMLDKYGCGGPVGVLRLLSARVTTWSMAHVRQGDRDLVQTTGEFVEEPTKQGAAHKLPPARKTVRLSLDAATLWPCRVEWWSDAPDAGGQLLWEQEYLEPRLGEALSLEECGRVFSYRP
jgi:hypothetical protein